MIYTLPKLDYSFEALEPYIDAKTMEIHYTKHHQAYVDNLNKALEKHPEVADRPLEELLANPEGAPEEIRSAVRNHGGGHFNHSLFWKMMAPQAGGEPSGKIGEAITKSFGDFGKFKELFGAAAMGRFGSGWAWMTMDKGQLKIESTPNQDSPLMEGKKPLLGVDVWEHAYYLKYQNRRKDYIDAWWNVVNWQEVERKFNSTQPHSV
jgi:Fe-Mn family superoxide dismutase